MEPKGSLLYSKIPLLVLSRARLMQSTPSHPIYIRSVLILSFNLRLRLCTGLSTSGFSRQNPVCIPLPSMRATCPPNLTLLDLIILFSNTLILCSSLNITDQVSHTYKTTDRIIVLYILIFTFLDSRRKDKGY
jgi:hypothetical protein